ncbi:Myosin phosphatase Rho-interacting protein [Holothuria leucospilota]|uniref:Myosin phosphatase Rho-interacting protein n=1 Tax=Holothuria leucospilota TaxID=206669 RepID=A0A9Q1C208_HOLLE|nr:Myosin phosphatase Rho-interacting protein [Holothuria leucospilota]
MYTCTQIYNAKNSIGHDHSMGIVTPEGTLFVKAETREEKDSWFPVLSEYPRINQEEENYKKKKKKKEERERAQSSNIPIKIDPSKEVPSPSAISEYKPGEKPSSSGGVTLGRMSSFKENIQPTKKADSKSQPQPSRPSHLKDSDQFNFRRSRSLREKRHSRQTEEEDDAVCSEEKDKDKPVVGPSTRKSHAPYDRPVNRRHTSPVKQVDFPITDLSKLKGERKPSNVKKDSEDEDSDSKENENTSKDRHSSDYMETLHRNNNNVYKPDRIEDVSQIPKRKNSSSDSVSSRSSQNSGLSDGTKATLTSPSKSNDPADPAVLTDEELARLDVPKRRNMRLTKVHGDPETHSPSKRTIEKRKHAKERRGRHTMDGSIQLIPVLVGDKEIPSKNSQSTLKRSNSDPNLADTEDVQQRRAIAEIFPGLYHLKNGWLNLMGKTDKDWTKHWFVLKDNKLSFYNDSKDDGGNLVGSFDLAGSEEAVDYQVERNYGFKVKMTTGEDIVLSAMTSAIRTKWVSALNKAILTAHSEGENSPVIEDTLITQLNGVTEKLLDKPVSENVTQVDSNKMEEVEETSEEPKRRGPAQRIRDRRSRRLSRGEEGKRDSPGRLSSDSSDVFFDAPSNWERKQPEGRSDSPDKVIADQQSGEINEVLGEAVDALEARLKVVEDENAALRSKNVQLLGGLDILRKHQIPLENPSEVEFVNQIEKLVKHRSKLEHEMEEQKIQLKQMRNAADLTEQKNQELMEQVASLKDELSKKQGDYDNLQSRFEKLVMDLREMETERSTTRTKIKEERDKTLDVIERLNKRIDTLERENLELREDVKQGVAEVERQKEKCVELEKRLAEGNEEVVVEHETPLEKSTAGLEGSGSSSSGVLEEQLEKAQRENTSLLAQLQGANRTTLILRQKLKEKEELVSQNTSSQDLEDMRKEVRDKEDEVEALCERLKMEEEKCNVLQTKYDQLVEDVSGRSQKTKNMEEQLAKEKEMRLKAEKGVIAAEAERTGLKDRISLCQSEIENLKMLNASLEEDKTSQLQQFASVENSLKLAVNEKRNLEEAQSKSIEEAENSRKEISAKEEVLKMLQDEIKRVKGEVSKQRHEVDRLQKENEDLYSRLDSANSETKAWQDKAENLIQQQEKMASQVGGVETQEEVALLREELVRERASSDAALRNLELEISSKEEELQTVSVQADDYQKQLQLLSDALKDKAEAVLRLEAELASKDESLATTNEQLLSKSDRLEKEVKRLRSQLAESQKSYDALEIQHMQVKDQQNQAESTYKTEMELMGRRIQDLTAKLSMAEKKNQNVDEILKEHEKMHQQSLEEVKQTYSEKLRSVEESRRKEQRCDAEALSTALEAVKRVYDERLQQERHLIKAGTAKDVDSMMRRHTDVVTHMNKDWVIMSSKFSELCRENAQLTGTITNLQKTLAETKDSIDIMQKANQARVDEIVSSISELKASQSKPEVELRVEEEGDQEEDEQMRMLNITLKLRELELKCAQDELKALRNLKEAASDVPSELQEPDGAVGGAVGEQYLHSGLKVSSL